MRNILNPKQFPFAFLILRSLIFFLILLFAFSPVAFASNSFNDSTTPTPTISPSPTPTATPRPAVPREIIRDIELINFHWALFRYRDDVFLCNIFLEKEGVPSTAQVRFSCGEEIVTQWQSTPICETPDNSQSCEGIYLKSLGELSTIMQESIVVPPPSVEVGLVNCTPWEDCLHTPRLSFTGIERLENQSITHVHIQVRDKKFSCAGSICIIDLPTTDEMGVKVIYWTESSYGDQSAHKSFQMRNLLIRDDLYQFELLGSQWAEDAPPCALTWESFPETTIGKAEWLHAIEGVEHLYTEHPYAWLGGRLIAKDIVDATACEDNGLLLNGSASTCGLEMAENVINEWQNQYNETIYESTREINLPARVLKGLIAQESQFYPQKLEDEYGLGMITEDGFDMLLNWNIPYFLDKCEPLYGEDDCAWGYDHMHESHQEYLWGRAFREIGTEDEIPLIANTLYAACGQTGQLVKNITGKAIQETIDYSELWQLTLALYHAGSGCIADGIEAVWDADQDLTWENVSGELEPDCDLAEEYVRNVIRYGLP